MANNLSDLYPGRVTTPDANYPGGSIQNETTPTVPATPQSPGSNDGTPLDKDWANDHEGFLQSLTSEAGITPSGTTDTALSSQRKDALKVIFAGGLYETTINYPVSSVAKGGDGAQYKALIANGPASSVVDPVGDVSGTWVKKGSVKITVLTASDPAWTPTTGTEEIRFRYIAGGGSAGSVDGQGTGNPALSGAGSPGAYGEKTTPTIDPAYNIVVGSGAPAPAAGNNPGTQGGSTSITSTSLSIVCEGGIGGAGDSGASGGANKGPLSAVRPTATGGDINIDGGLSHEGRRGGGSIVSASYSVDSQFGSGGPTVFTRNGLAGQSPGAGGGATVNDSNSNDYQGGAGADGVVIIEERF